MTALYQIVIICIFIYIHARQRIDDENNKKKIMVVLGCGMEDLQNDRIKTAVDYVDTLDTSVVWFLTGGVKHAIVRETEASKMEKYINKNAHQIVLDEHATNTAENFAYLQKWLKTENIKNPEIIITTSAFHKERAEKIFNGIMDNETEVTWNLSKGACATCWNDEKIHMKNVENDVKKARKI